MPFTRRTGLVKAVPALAKALLTPVNPVTVSEKAKPTLDLITQNVHKCTSCQIHCTSTIRPIIRGTVPCEVLFIGEANAPRDQVFNSPMFGESGEVVNEWITALQKDFKAVSCAVTNLVKCVPILKVPVDGKDHRAVTKGEAEECEKHLVAIMDLCDPSVIVMMGESAKRWTPRHRNCEYVHVKHPSFIRRSYERATLAKVAYNAIYKACEVQGLIF